MRHIGAIVWMLACAAAADADTVVVKGELSFTAKGIGKVLECKSGRIFTLGAMASNPYFSLVQRYWRLSHHGKTPVLIEVRGDVSKTRDPQTELILQSPSVNALVDGRCSDTLQNSAREQMHER